MPECLCSAKWSVIEYDQTTKVSTSDTALGGFAARCMPPFAPTDVRACRYMTGTAPTAVTRVGGVAPDVELFIIGVISSFLRRPLFRILGFLLYLGTYVGAVD